jgi:mannose-6-phosphate isomerase-like protein (cupin superfamily)
LEIFEISEVIEETKKSKQNYLEFLRVPALSCGLYMLPTGSMDNQEPHTEDEVYYVVSGRGTIQVGNENHKVQPGTMIFVAANVEHRFREITENLKILVLFAPAECSQGPGK